MGKDSICPKKGSVLCLNKMHHATPRSAIVLQSCTLCSMRRRSPPRTRLVYEFQLASHSQRLRRRQSLKHQRWRRTWVARNSPLTIIKTKATTNIRSNWKKPKRNTSGSFVNRTIGLLTSESKYLPTYCLLISLFNIHYCLWSSLMWMKFGQVSGESC